MMPARLGASPQTPGIFSGSLGCLHFRGKAFDSGLMSARKRLAWRMEVSTPTRSPRSQGWQSVNPTADRHKLNMPIAQNHLNTINELDSPARTTGERGRLVP